MKQNSGNKKYQKTKQTHKKVTRNQKITKIFDTYTKKNNKQRQKKTTNCDKKHP